MSAPTWLDTGLEWHACGEIVLPIVFRRKKSGKGWDKIPLVDYAHWKDGTPQTVEDIRSMKTNDGRAAWEVAEGVAILLWPSGRRIVVDLDGDGAGGLLVEAGIEIPATGIMHTRSGGLHHHFTVPAGTLRPDADAPDRDKRTIRLLHQIDANGKPCKPAVDFLFNGIVVVAGPNYREDPDYPVDLEHLAEIPAAIIALAREKNRPASSPPSGTQPRTEYAELLRGVPLGVQHDTSTKLIGHLLTKLPAAEVEAIMDGWCDRCDPPADKRKVRKNLADLAAKGGPKAKGEAPVVVNLADVKPEPVTWLWPGRIPRGKLTLIIGDPDKGKSCVTLDAAARVSTGKHWPDGTPAPRGDVILLTAEDGLSDTVRPRLDAMGGDPARAHVLKAIRTGDRERGVDLSLDLPHLEAVLKATGAILVVIDPVSAYLGKTDSWRDADVRAVLAPLAALAERTGGAVVGIMHLTKDRQRQALYRAQGNISFVAAARAVFAVAEDREDPERRLLLPVKLNIAHKPPGLAFRVVEAGTAVRVDWEPGPVDVDVEDALAGPEPTAERSEREEAKDFLHEVLADGPVAATEVKKQAKALGIALRTLFRAKGELKVKAEKSGFRGPWLWSLPPKIAKVAMSPYIGNGGNVGNLGETEAPAEVVDL